jgi:hypothetical protein
MKSVITTALALSLFACGHAYADVITFDSLPTSTIVKNQFPGVSFKGAQVFTAGVNLNPEFPPVSNPNVVQNYRNGRIVVTFTTPVSSVGAFVTGDTSITERIFSGATKLGHVSTGGANEVGAGTGLPQNIFLQLSAFDITRVVFTNRGGPANTFTLDNFTFTHPAAVPGPLMGAGLPAIVAACGGLLLLARRRRRQGVV